MHVDLELCELGHVDHLHEHGQHFGVRFAMNVEGERGKARKITWCLPLSVVNDSTALNETARDESARKEPKNSFMQAKSHLSVELAIFWIVKLQDSRLGQHNHLGMTLVSSNEVNAGNDQATRMSCDAADSCRCGDGWFVVTVQSPRL